MLSSLGRHKKTTNNKIPQCKPKPVDNRGTSADVDVMFEYTGDGCSVPKDVTSVRFQDGLQKIGVSAFQNCTSLKSITIPSTVTEIGNDAFRDCSNLREVILNDGLQKIGDCAFSKCSSFNLIRHAS